MSLDSTKELIFQNEMIAQLEAKGWICGKAEGYDRERALYSQDALTFVQTTQPQEWEKFAKVYPTDTERHFLDALVAQLKNQDPTNPMENNELTSQLAQISTVSGIEKLNTTLGSISGQIDNSQSLQASNLIGHGVMIPGTTVLAGTGSEEGAVTTTTPFGVELQQAADKVTATITDKNGAVVRTIDIGELTAGVHSFTWDGTLTDGSTAPNGSYNVAISASNGGTQLVAQPLQFALVQGVIRGNSGNTLDLGTYGTTTLDEVRQII